jgi:hypothetical protein
MGRGTTSAPARDALKPEDARRALAAATLAYERDVADLPEAARAIGRKKFMDSPAILRLRAASMGPTTGGSRLAAWSKPLPGKPTSAEPRLASRGAVTAAIADPANGGKFFIGPDGKRFQVLPRKKPTPTTPSGGRANILHWAIDDEEKRLELQAIAEANVARRREGPGAGSRHGRAVGASFLSMLPFEAGTRLEAALRRQFAPQGKNFDEQLDIVRLENQMLSGESLPGQVFGGAGGILTGGGGASLAVRGAGNALSRIPGLATVGRGLAASQTLRQGETAANVLKLAATGAAFGGAEAAVRGEDALDRKSTRLNSSHHQVSRMPSSA